MAVKTEEEKASLLEDPHVVVGVHSRAGKTVAGVGCVLILFLGGGQALALCAPRSVYAVNFFGGLPTMTDPKAYFAWNVGFAWADVVVTLPLQLIAGAGVFRGKRWGYALLVAASVPYVYSALPCLVWDRSFHVDQPTIFWWAIVFALWPVFGLLQFIIAFLVLLRSPP